MSFNYIWGEGLYLALERRGRGGLGQGGAVPESCGQGEEEGVGQCPTAGSPESARLVGLCSRSRIP